MRAMRPTLAVLAVLLLPACSSWLPDLSGLPGAEALGLAAALPEAEAEEVPAAAQVQAAGEPALYLRWGSRAAVAVLAQQSGENRMWRSPGGVVVATDGARVVATAGLRDWLASTRLDGPDPLDEPLALVGREAPLRRQVDLMRSDRSPDGMRFGLSLSCRLRGGLTEGGGGTAGPAGGGALPRRRRELHQPLLGRPADRRHLSFGAVDRPAGAAVGGGDQPAQLSPARRTRRAT
jgi:hypothetical protein